MKKIDNEEFSDILDVTETAQKLLQNKVTLNQRGLSGEEIKTMVEDGRLDLDPWFQRDQVWDNDQKVKLVDSFLSKTPIPAIYLEMYKIDDDGFEHFRVVDGKQRISALQSFIEGDLVLNYEGQPPTLWKGKKWNKEYKIQEIFKKRTISCVVLDTHICSDEERETVESYVFQRWNDSSALTQGEIRHSIKSDLNTLIVHQGLLDFCLGEVGSSIIKKKNKRKELNEILERLVHRFYSDENISHVHPTHKILIQFHKKVLNKEKLESIKKEIISGVEYLAKNNRLTQAKKTINLNMKIDLLVLMTYLKRVYGKQKIEHVFDTYINQFIDMVVRYKQFSKKPENTTDDDKSFMVKYNRFFDAFRGGVNGNNQFRFDIFKQIFLENFPQQVNDSERLFSRETKEFTWLKQKCKCAKCNTEVTLEESEADHVIEWSRLGQTTEDNCEVLCKTCHKEKTKNFMIEKNLFDCVK